MIPVRDVIPSRTRPGVTLALLAVLAVALAWCGVRQWWLPWCLHVVALWVFGSTVEDRLGHARFLLLVLTSVVAAIAGTRALGLTATVPADVAGAVAGVSAAYFLMFPRSRVLTLVPVMVGVEIVDVPAWFVISLWALVQAATAWSHAVWTAPPDALAAPAGIIFGAVTGGLAWVVLRRPERMRVEWWDVPSR